MKSLSTTAESKARQAWQKVSDPTKVNVKVCVVWMGDICLPAKESDEEVNAIFNVFTFGDNYAVERATAESIPVGNGTQSLVISEPNEYRRLMLKKNLVAWSLPIPIERAGGWITSECYEHIGNVCGPLLDALLDKFYVTTTLTEEEEFIMDRQSANLFSENSRGVANACEAVSLFCTLGSFNEKFGINREMLPVLPFREYLMLKVMGRKEGEAARQRSSPRKTSTTRVMGPGGKTRPSRGKRMAG